MCHQNCCRWRTMGQLFQQADLANLFDIQCAACVGKPTLHSNLDLHCSCLRLFVLSFFRYKVLKYVSASSCFFPELKIFVKALLTSYQKILFIWLFKYKIFLIREINQTPLLIFLEINNLLPVVKNELVF